MVQTRTKIRIPRWSHPSTRITPATVPAGPSPAGSLPTPSTSQTVATTDNRSPTTTGPAPPASPHPKPCSTPSVASTESKRQSRTAVVVRSPQSCLSTHVPNVLTPLQVQYTSARIQWLGRRSLSNFSPPSPVTAPSDKNQRYTRPSPALLVYPGLCGPENTEISTS